MDTLITPTEVALAAFGANPELDHNLIGKSTILAAQEKFIRPVLGKLFDKIDAGHYPLLLENYIKPPLAVFVKLLLLPQLAVKAGNGGLTQHRSSNFSYPTPQAVYDLHQSLRSEANILLRRAVSYIEENLSQFPEYDPQENILNYVSIRGDIVF